MNDTGKRVLAAFERSVPLIKNTEVMMTGRQLDALVIELFKTINRLQTEMGYDFNQTLVGTLYAVGIMHRQRGLVIDASATVQSEFPMIARGYKDAGG